MSDRSMSLGDLRAKAPTIWRNQRDRKQTTKRLETCVDILGPDTPIAQVRTKDLDRLKETLWSRPGIESPQTINRYLAALSRALRWASQRDEIGSLPHVPREPGEPFRVAYFTEEEERAVLRFFMSRGKPHVATLFRVLSVTGLRISELTALRPGDVDMGSIHVRRSKNKRDRFVPLEPPLDTALRAAIVAGLPSYVGMNKYLHRARKACGIEDEKTLHVFRHTCATRLTRLGVPTAVVKDFLGHRSIQTTLKYAHVEEATLRAAARVLEGSSNLTAVVLPSQAFQSLRGIRRAASH